MRPILARLAAAALLLAGVSGLVFMLWPGEEPVPTSDEHAPVARVAPTVEAAESPAPPSTPAERLDAAERAIAAAHAQRAAALADLAAAEAEMEPREREVERLERFIADLEARGDDPAEHPEEGLALFNLALEGYRRTALRLEQAQGALRAADESLAKAERPLAALQPGRGSQEPE